MTEIWVPYGPVEVSFDVKQENLSQILEPQPAKIAQEDLEKKVDLVSEDTVLLLSRSAGTLKFLDLLLTRNKSVRRLFLPKSLSALGRRKSQEFGVEAVPFGPENLTDVGEVDGSHVTVPSQLKENPRIVLLTSPRYDPLFGLTSAASDVVSLVPELKAQAFRKSTDELPCAVTKSEASAYSIRLIKSAVSRTKTVEVVEKTGTGILTAFYGEVESVHSESVAYWMKDLKVELPSKVERVIFGCGGSENDRTLTNALSRAFFSIISNVVMHNSDPKICMLAECSQGLGSEAFLQYVTGRFEPRTKLENLSYFDGLEVLLAFQKVQTDVQLTILTTLPKFYASKFDFRTIAGAREAPLSVMQQGSRAKILVVPDASSCYFST